MTAVTIKGTAVGYHFDDMRADEPLYWCLGSEGTEAGDSRIVVLPVEITIDVGDLNIVAAKTAALEAAKKKALDDFNATVAQINEQLSKLQAIAHDPAPDAPDLSDFGVLDAVSRAAT